MFDDTVSPFGGPDRMRSGKVTIPERPIEAGTYSWGWVEYGEYRGEFHEPQTISVTMFPEPTDERSMRSLYRTLSRPRFISMALSYGPVILGFLCFVVLGSFIGAAGLGFLYLIAVLFSAWMTLKYSRSLKLLAMATEVWGDRSLESYIAGRDFLRALTHEDLPRGEISAYFNLRAQASELRGVISDTVN